MKTSPPNASRAIDREAIARGVFAVLAATLLLLQVAAFVSAKLSTHRFFCWAPYDQYTSFEIKAIRHGRPLDAAAIAARYHLPARGENPRSTYEILGTIRRYESTYGRDQHISVSVTYRVNGGSPRVWTWPEDTVSP